MDMGGMSAWLIWAKNYAKAKMYQRRNIDKDAPVKEI